MTNSNVVESKRFVIRKSLIGKNQVITFTTKKGDEITYNHDVAFNIMIVLYFITFFVSECNYLIFTD